MRPTRLGWMLLIVLSLLATLQLARTLHAKGGDGSFVELKIGDPPPDFTLPDVLNAGKTVHLADLKGKIVVLAWDSKNCPVANAYHDRFNAFCDAIATHDKTSKYAVVFLAINSNVNPLESLTEIQDAAKATHANYPILKDADCKVADLYGAQTTPHMFVIDPQGSLAYREAFDNDQKTAKADHHYVADAVASLEQDKAPSTTVTKSFGCSVKRP